MSMFGDFLIGLFFNRLFKKIVRNNLIQTITIESSNGAVTQNIANNAKNETSKIVLCVYIVLQITHRKPNLKCFEINNTNLSILLICSFCFFN